MKRFLKYIFLALTFGILTGSCIEEMDVAQPVSKDDGLTTLVPRVKSFTNQYVTKSAYGETEQKISRLAVLIFNNDGALVHMEEKEGDITSMTINKSMLNSPEQKEKLTAATVVMIANQPLASIQNSDGKSLVDNKASLTLKGMEDYSFIFEEGKTVVTDLGKDFSGFPMIGGTKVDLSSTKAQQGAVEVGLKILYAKINFYISVENGTENEGTGMNFSLTGYSVHNTSRQTTLAIPANAGEPVVDFLGNSDTDAETATADGATASSVYEATGATDDNAFGTYNLGNEPAKAFTFYVSESRYNHGRYNHNSGLTGIYPDDSWLTSDPKEDVKDYDPETDADKLNGVKYFYDDLIQQYKPKLAEIDGGTPGTGLATYVVLTGTYTDYRGTAWDVNYKVYLGKDNAQNFHVDRNSEYTNYITIKGIRNNNSYGEGQVWVDHRVDVSYNGTGADDHVTITRETLIDSHIEVRPLRVKWDGDEYDGVRVYLPTDSNGNLINWIGIERFTGENNQEATTYCFIDDESTGKKKSTGKRKYFTTDLISELQTKEGEYGVRTDDDSGKKYIYLLNEECAWIYFDENTDTQDRSAEITLEFYTKSGTTQTEVYKVTQRGLQNVGGYYIESYEEYLHSYDSADKYNLSTSPVDYTQQGLGWGFLEYKLSQNILVSSTTVNLDLTKTEMIKRYSYDYFHESDGSNYNLYTRTSGSWGNASFGTGLDFTDRASANRDIAVKDMGTIPENAYQYCLSKNKFEADDFGNVTMSINWYLPDAYEMQAILAAGQSGNTLVDIDSDAFYWSSQPSFNTEGLTYINEDSENARAVSAQGITDLPRERQNRIRCVYTKDGIHLDEEAMEDRVPEGIGGNYTIYMKAWDNNKAKAYFNEYLPTAKEQSDTTEWEYNDNYGTNYPKAGDNISGEKFKYVEITAKDRLVKGFDKNPADVANWTEHERADGYYTTLTKYGGLSEFTLDKHWLYDAYKPSTTSTKSGTQTKTTKRIKKLDKKLPSATDLKTLDHLTDGNMLNISFKQDKGSNQPAFVYDEVVSGETTTKTVKWSPPEYITDDYELEAETHTINTDKFTESDTGISTGTSSLQQASVDDAKKMAFDGTTSTSTILNQVEGAYPKAKKAAETNLNKKLEDYPTSEGWIYGEYEYTPLSWNQQNSNIQWSTPDIETSKSWFGREYTSKVTIKCTVTVTASVTITKPSSGTVFIQVNGTGQWSLPKEGEPDPLPASINTDEMRMYCGNSFTISLSEEAKNQGYEISKVKVNYSGNNYIGETGGFMGIGTDKVYARFVDSEINLADYKLENQPVIGSTETLKLPGMDYSADGENGWHEWTGSDRTSVTLVLADYNVNYNATSINYSYLYDTSPMTPSKYIIVDQIEVKCAKRKNATFNFAKIYADYGNTTTSECTVKNITLTTEGGTEDNPSGVTADGLKLYAGSKVTFKALDGYVINSITGDESLTFKGSQQVVEFTVSSDKTISSEIIVLYSKAETEN